MKKKAVMAVMNTLHTDARVQRAAAALSETFDLTLIGVEKDCGFKPFRQEILHIKQGNSIVRYKDYVKQVKQYLSSHEFDLFYAHDYFSASVAEWTKRKFPRKVVVYDSHELIFPAEGFSTTLRDSFFRFFEKRTIRSADLIVCASNERKRLMLKYYKMKKSPIVIENVSLLPDLDDEYSKGLIEKIEKAIGNKKTRLVYAGILVSGRKIDRLIDVVSNRNETTLLIIGEGPDRERLQDMAEKKIKGRYFFTGGLPYQYMGAVLKKCSVGYISYPTDSLNNTYCAPNKIYEYASVDLPMIATENPTIRRFFDVYSIGVIDNDLGRAFDVVQKDLMDFKTNCKSFTDNHPWSEKSELLCESIQELMR